MSALDNVSLLRSGIGAITIVDFERTTVYFASHLETHAEGKLTYFGIVPRKSHIRYFSGLS